MEHHPDTEARIEALLHEAAAFEPARSAPDDLVSRAMERCARQRRRNRRQAGVIGGFAIGFASLLLVLGRVTSSTPSLTPEPPRPGVSTTALPDPRPERTGDAQTPLTRVAEAPPEPRQRQVRRKRARRPQFAHRRPLRRERLPRAVPEAARPLWTTEVVRREAEAVLTPAWLAQRDEEKGEWLVTPGVLEIPTGASACADPSSSESETAPAAEPMAEQATEPTTGSDEPLSPSDETKEGN